MTAHTITNNSTSARTTTAQGTDRHSGAFGNLRAPMTNIRKGETKTTLEVALPGIAKDHIEINVKNRVLTIQVVRQEERTGRDERVIRREIPARFSDIRYRIGENLNIDAMTAELRDGVLRIELPHIDPSALNRSIEIQ